MFKKHEHNYWISTVSSSVAKKAAEHDSCRPLVTNTPTPRRAVIQNDRNNEEEKILFHLSKDRFMMEEV